MENSIYQRLAQAAQRDVDRFGQYEAQCRKFISALRQSLVRDLGCPEDRVTWLQLVDNAVETDPRGRVVEVSLDQRMALESTAYYQFALRIGFTGCFVDVPGRLRMDLSGFTLHAAGTTYQATSVDPEALRPIGLDIATRIETFLERRFENFVEERTTPMGFIRSKQ